MNTTIKIIGISTTILLSLLIPKPNQAIVESKTEVVETGPVTETIQSLPATDTPTVSTYEFYPKSVEERKQALTQELLANGASGEMVATLLYIGKRESINTFSPSITPSSEVRHCKRPNGTFYAVEITKERKQASCASGDTQTYTERSIGIWQILPSTFKGYKCTGNIENWKDQVKCAIVLANSSKGFNHWVAWQKALVGK